MNWFNTRLVGYGFLLGTAGVKLLSGKSAKKVYTHVTAAALRCCDDAAKTYDLIRENCGDILSDAKDINEQYRAEDKERMIEEAKAILAENEAEQ